MYDYSGAWMGLPAKSGVGGGMAGDLGDKVTPELSRVRLTPYGDLFATV